MLKKINELKREKAIKKITGNLGFVIETEDKLICYVKKENCSLKVRFPDDAYVISLRNYKKENKDLVEKYYLDKKIVYVLDGLTFNRKEPVVIEDYDGISEIEIKNCRFEDGLEISNPKKCTIKNTIINNDWFCCVNNIKAIDLIIDNVNINTNTKMNQANNTIINASNLLKIKSSKIKADYCEIGNIKTKEVNIENSIFEANREIKIEARSLTAKLSRAISNFEISIYTKVYDKLLGLSLDAYSIYVNEEILQKEKTETPISLRPLNDLDKIRKMLLKQLKERKDELIKQREEKVALVISSYNEQPIGKLLSRRKT